MGSLGDNLLKLTEFPFSYSFIGLLALIFGEGLNFTDEQFLERLGPLLILMGFIATTLSITDPIGALQKALLVGSSQKQYTKLYYEESSLEYAQIQSQSEHGFNPEYAKIEVDFMVRVQQRIASLTKEAKKRRFSLSQLIREVITRQEISMIITTIPIPSRVIVCLCQNFQDVFLRYDGYKAEDKPDHFQFGNLFNSSSEPSSDLFHKLLRRDDAWEILTRLTSLKESTSRTSWIVREIDKITALGYFIIVLVTLISALFLLPNFEDKFLVTFQGGNQTQDDSMVTNGGATTTMATNAAAATSTAVESEGTSIARIIIIAFSIIALGAVSYMLYKRLSELKSKAWTTFKFLIELDAIKIENQRFNQNLKDIERYLSNSDWTMAELWVDGIMEEYAEVVQKELIEKKGTTAEKSKEGEKKIMITWKQKSDELSVEEVKDEEEKKKP
jgi:hypothetical protein